MAPVPLVAVWRPRKTGSSGRDRHPSFCWGRDSLAIQLGAQNIFRFKHAFWGQMHFVLFLLFPKVPLGVLISVDSVSMLLRHRVGNSIWS